MQSHNEIGGHVKVVPDKPVNVALQPVTLGRFVGAYLRGKLEAEAKEMNEEEERCCCPDA